MSQPQTIMTTKISRTQKELIFDLNENLYSIEVTQVQEVIQNIQKVINIPHAPIYIEGLIAFHDFYIPLFNLKKYFNIVGDYSSHNIGVVLNIQEKLYGIRVDNIHQIIDIPTNSIKPLHHSQQFSDTSFIRGVGEYNKSNFIALNLDKILLAGSREIPEINYENK